MEVTIATIAISAICASIFSGFSSSDKHKDDDGDCIEIKVKIPHCKCKKKED
ncbi:MAG: hypothetical protein SAJ12_18410 [Jaaginema sp. PMC 1079.18]|nr:hypothetical protein [Jaaginema sp. PMC 1080.18]MEC4852959.1 hypothetical protein [Jaaginema sp. PMC 1079.18]MEC4867409.1 hypothetical protein [Jaaginema sp. PMC 1078.18]